MKCIGVRNTATPKKCLHVPSFQNGNKLDIMRPQKHLMNSIIYRILENIIHMCNGIYLVLSSNTLSIL